MIQFAGLSFSVEPAGLRAAAVVVDRKARLLGTGSAQVAGVTPGPGGRLEVRPGEWIRAGSLALRDGFFQIPARIRRFWGFSIAGPEGWVALDPALEPLGPIHVTPSPREDFLAWLATDPRLRAHIYAVLAPKDYFRYAVSGGLAVDATQAGSLGFLEEGRTSWLRKPMDELGLLSSWFPPVFDSTVVTGRISEEGIRHTGLPGGLWVVAGAAAGAGGLISAADLRKGVLLLTAPEPNLLEIRAAAAGLVPETAPEGFEPLRAPFPGYRVLRRRLPLPSGGAEAAAESSRASREAIERMRGSEVPGLKLPERIVIDYRAGLEPPWAAGLLGQSGLPAELSPHAGADDPGLAYIAGLAQGGFRSLDDLYRKLREAREEEAPSPKEG
jgi:hypothetical protein